MSKKSQESRAAVEAVLDLIASNPTFRQQIIDNPQAAIQMLGLSQKARGKTHRRPCSWTCIRSGTCNNTCGTPCNITE
jgi:hypothetical protein